MAFVRRMGFLLMALLVVMPGGAQESGVCGDSVTVQSGDTLYSIAQRCGTSVAVLLEANPDVTDFSAIPVGQVVNIPSTSEPVVTVYPLQGGPGTQVTVTGNGFPPNASISVDFGPVNGPPVLSRRMDTDRSGSMRQAFTIPTDYRPETLRWHATVTVLYGGLQGQSHLFVLSGDAPPPTDTPTPSFEEVIVYLVQPDMTAPRCQENLIPFEIDVDETVAPLTAGLNAMFGFSAPGNRGDNAPRNEFVNSNLMVQGIDIDDGLAEIRLTGELNSLGVCSPSYMPAQIRQTALQYNTIDRVEITVNGVPIEDALNN